MSVCEEFHTGAIGAPCVLCKEIVPPDLRVGSRDPINPPHYGAGSGGIECIDAIVAALGVEGAANFCRGNAIKYLWRGGKKDAVAQDLKKSIWYINKEIELRGGVV